MINDAIILHSQIKLIGIIPIVVRLIGKSTIRKLYIIVWLISGNLRNAYCSRHVLVANCTRWAFPRTGAHETAA